VKDQDIKSHECTTTRLCQTYRRMLDPTYDRYSHVETRLVGELRRWLAVGKCLHECVVPPLSIRPDGRTASCIPGLCVVNVELQTAVLLYLQGRLPLPSPCLFYVYKASVRPLESIFRSTRIMAVKRVLCCAVLCFAWCEVQILFRRLHPCSFPIGQLEIRCHGRRSGQQINGTASGIHAYTDIAPIQSPLQETIRANSLMSNVSLKWT